MKIEKWDDFIHTEFEQLKRTANSKKIKPKDIIIDFENQTARVTGRAGIYDVTFDSCNCMDCAITRLPRKHLYRLATELGLVTNLPVINESAKEEFEQTLPKE